MSTVAVSKGFSTVIFGGLGELLTESRLELRAYDTQRQRNKGRRWTGQARITVES